MKIEVLGIGCDKCEAVYRKVLDTCSSAGVVADVEKVSQMDRIVAYGVLLTPAVAVEGQVVACGRIPSAEEIRDWVARP